MSDWRGHSFACYLIMSGDTLRTSGSFERQLFRLLGVADVLRADERLRNPLNVPFAMHFERVRGNYLTRLLFG
jgi:hypothetical protein